jgi:3',5'-cyclic AMP phosphodiesterase CpdA
VRNNRSAYDLIILLGDLAYDLESQDCERGDFFLRNLSTFTPYLPMLITPGNHDTGNNTYFDYLKYSFYTP